MGQDAFKYFRPTAQTHKSCTLSWCRQQQLWQVYWQPMISSFDSVIKRAHISFPFFLFLKRRSIKLTLYHQHESMFLQITSHEIKTLYNLRQSEVFFPSKAHWNVFEIQMCCTYIKFIRLRENKSSVLMKLVVVLNYTQTSTENCPKNKNWHYLIGQKWKYSNTSSLKRVWTKKQLQL